MNRLGLGLLSKPQQTPPLPGNIISLFDPTAGIVASGGFVDSWTATFGGDVAVAAGATRPARGADYLEFDGVDDAIGCTAIGLGGLGAVTLAYWLRRDAAQVATAVPVEQNSYPAGILTTVNATFIDAYPDVAVARTTGPAPADTWSFLAMVFDGSLAAGQKTKLFTGTTPAAIANTTAFDNTTVTAIGAAVGSFVMGGRATVFFKGRIGLVAAYNTPLTLPQIQALAAYRVPA